MKRTEFKLLTITMLLSGFQLATFMLKPMRTQSECIRFNKKISVKEWFWTKLVKR